MKPTLDKALDALAWLIVVSAILGIVTGLIFMAIYATAFFLGWLGCTTIVALLLWAVSRLLS
jgi:hypothetical protein